MTGTDFELKLKQGARISATFYVVDSAGAPVSLAGYTAAKMEIRKGPGAPVIAEFSTSAGKDGLLTINGSAGTVTLLVATAKAALFPANWTGETDLFLYTAAGERDEFGSGSVKIYSKDTA
jgi:hypothetical protein